MHRQDLDGLYLTAWGKSVELCATRAASLKLDYGKVKEEAMQHIKSCVLVLILPN